MGWKSKKQKELSPEEAIALAKQELAHYWHHVSPLFAGVRGPQGTSAIPLEPLFQDHSWLLIFCDPTGLSGEAAVHFAKECNRRYQIHDLNVLLMLRAPFAFLKDRSVIEEFIEKRGIQFAVALDHDGSISDAFESAEGVRVILLGAKGRHVDASGENWMVDAETGIQKFLRSTDPGLPLLPVAGCPDTIAQDGLRLDFGRGRGLSFPVPGFKVPMGDFFVAEFPAEGGATVIDGVPFAISGKWMQSGDFIATSDPMAQISLHSPESGMAIVAQPLKATVDGAQIIVEVNGIPVPDIFADEALSYDDEGRSLLRAHGARLYRVLKKLPERERNITLRFQNADQSLVALHGIRFWRYDAN